MAENGPVNESWKEARKLLNLVTSAIDCILRDRYEGYIRKPFYLELGAEIGPGASHTAEEIEKFLEMFLHKPELYRPETTAAFEALKEEHTHERLATFLKQFVDIPLEAELALVELREKTWEEILIWIDGYIYQRSCLERQIGELIVKQREGFGDPKSREMESAIETSPRGFRTKVSASVRSMRREEFSNTCTNDIGSRLLGVSTLDSSTSRL